MALQLADYVSYAGLPFKHEAGIYAHRNTIHSLLIPAKITLFGTAKA
ncbi:hypothetical protein A1D15_1755 [Lactiplantibacillus plantarum]|nr:hypothetical protein [Lactiplantibacillus plantarum]KZU93784.1 hypothetical protein A1D15_1755 [Lactiplantibacillus plantarum]